MMVGLFERTEEEGASAVQAVARLTKEDPGTPMNERCRWKTHGEQSGGRGNKKNARSVVSSVESLVVGRRSPLAARRHSCWLRRGSRRSTLFDSKSFLLPLGADRDASRAAELYAQRKKLLVARIDLIVI
jgi:hypothetical protein